MKQLTIITLATLSLIACKHKDETNSQTTNLDTLFNTYKQSFVEELWKTNPGQALMQGYHKYDSVLIIPNEESRKKQNIFYLANLDSLKKFDLSTLSPNNRIDYYLIQNCLKSYLWYNDTLKIFEWDPTGYNIGEAFAEILNGSYDKLENRLKNIGLKLTNVTNYYEAAKTYIKNPTVEHTELAINQNLGSASIFEKDIIDSVNKSSLTAAEKEQIISKAKEATLAINGYVEWLKKLKNDTPRSFRLGKDLYERKFEYQIQSAFSSEQIYQRALQRKQELHSEMTKISKELWSKYFSGKPMPANDLQVVRMMIDKLSENHVKADSFQTEIERQIPALVDFIKKKELIYIDPSKPLVVRKEPAYMAGVAGASISAPGPYDKNANTYYNVGSLSGWEKEKAESYLREYNHYILQILNIHEAIPGHYTQLVYSNQSPSIIKSIFGNGAMVEGWAVYGERMMLESGYGNNEPEMWLMYYKWHLRSVCNTILDHSVHVLEMTKEEALKLLVDEAFQQKAEAEGKWRRVSLTQVQLCSYFTGYTEIYDLREELKTKMGDAFSLKAFHEKFLSYGSSPVKYIRELMVESTKN